MPSVTITNVHYLDSSPFRRRFGVHEYTVRCRRTITEEAAQRGIKQRRRGNVKGNVNGKEKADAGPLEKEPATAFRSCLPYEGKQLDADFARIGYCCGLENLVLGSNFFFGSN